TLKVALFSPTPVVFVPFAGALRLTDSEEREGLLETQSLVRRFVQFRRDGISQHRHIAAGRPCSRPSRSALLPASRLRIPSAFFSIAVLFPSQLAILRALELPGWVARAASTVARSWLARFAYASFPPAAAVAITGSPGSFAD